MSPKIDLTGQRFGKLVAVKPTHKNGRRAWICKCDCGNETIVTTDHLRSGATVSCGCYQSKRASESNYKHGQTHTSLHNRWKAIRERCNNPNNERYEDYGKRGIKLCEEWNDFSAFYDWAVHNGYEKNLQLDRIDSNKGYSPDNCRWCTCIINNHNRRNTAKIGGIPLKDFAHQHGISYAAVHSRYYRLLKRGIQISTESIINYAG